VGGPVPPAVHEPAAAMRWLGKPGPAYPGFPAQGASAPTGGRAEPRLSPDKREGGLPGRGVSESAGRGAPKEGRGPKGSTGEGTPRRDPGGPAGRSRPNGRVVATKGPQPRRPRPICGGAARPHRASHGAARPNGPTTASPRPELGSHGQLRLKGGKERETLGLHRTGCVQVNLWAGCVGVTLEMKKVHEGAPLYEGGFLLF